MLRQVGMGHHKPAPFPTLKTKIPTAKTVKLPIQITPMQDSGTRQYTRQYLFVLRLPALTKPLCHPKQCM